MFLLLAFIGFPGLGFGACAAASIGKTPDYSNSFLITVAVIGIGAFAITLTLAIKAKNKLQ